MSRFARNMMTLIALSCFVFSSFAQTVRAQDSLQPKRIGIIGATTSHVVAFTKQINDPKGDAMAQRYQVTAAYAGGMPDNPGSWDRVAEYTKFLVDNGVTMYPTIKEMLKHVDFVLLESVDGRPHLEQAKPVIAAGIPMFIDKPIAGSLADVLEMFRLADEKKVPLFSSSSLRYGKVTQEIRQQKLQETIGKVLGCESYSPCAYNDKHPDFYWYGVHGVETLFTIMGTGCQSVTRTHSDDFDVTVGLWDDGRIGSFRGIRQGKADYGARVFAEKAIVEAGKYDGYAPLVVEFCQFFDNPAAVPVDAKETIEIFAFMTAADISRAEGGRSVTLNEAIERARQEVAINVSIIIPADIASQKEKTVLFDGKKLPVEKIANMIDSLKSQKANSVVKVILRSEKGVTIEEVQNVTDQLKDAYLANYLYE